MFLTFSKKKKRKKNENFLNSLSADDVHVRHRHCL